MAPWWQVDDDNVYQLWHEITDLLNIKNIIITIHDWYWMHEYTMKKFFDDHFPPIHTNYLRKNIKIDKEFECTFNI